MKLFQYIKCSLLAAVLLAMLLGLGAFTALDLFLRAISWCNKRRKMYMLHFRITGAAGIN